MHDSTPPPSDPQISVEPASPDDVLAVRLAEVRALSGDLHAFAVGANSAARLLPRRNLRGGVIDMTIRLCQLLDRLQPERAEAPADPVSSSVP